MDISDVMAGALVSARDDGARVQTLRTELGTIPGPTEAWLLLRGIRHRIDGFGTRLIPLERKLSAAVPFKRLESGGTKYEEKTQ
jgi:hypothetical protein